MRCETLLGVYREQVFSPGKIQADAAVMDATLHEMSSLGWRVKSVRGEMLDASMEGSPYVLSMAQSDRVLKLLQDWTDKGARIINSAQSIRNCYRKPLTHLLLEGRVPIPFSRIVALEDAGQAAASLLSKRLWLKRGDVHAIQEGDVAAVETTQGLAGALEHYRSHQVRDLLIQEHVEGPVVKFYGVARRAFFRAYLVETGKDISPSVDTLANLAENAARVLGLEVYGGDAVLTQENGPILIDMNDWPSFSRCFRPAARCIATYFTEETRHSGDWNVTNSRVLSRA